MGEARMTQAEIEGAAPRRYLAGSFTERPCAAPGLKSYRCRSRFGWIMIGATDDREALTQARRSCSTAKARDLQAWNGNRYVELNSLDRGDC